MKRIALMILVGLLLYFSLQSQSNARLDSLVEKTRSNLRDPFLTISLADSLMELSEKADYQFGLASAAKFKGIGLYYSGRPDSAFLYYQTSLELFTELEDTLEVAKALLNMATYYNSGAEYEQSIEHSLKALEGFKQVEDLNGVGRVLNIIGQSYYFQQDYQGALSYFKQYLGNALLVADSVEIASAKSNTGAAFEMLHMYDSALYYLESAIALKERLNFQGNMGTSYYNAGDLYSDLGDYRKAQGYFKKALSFYKNVNDTMRMAELYQQLADMDYKQGKLRGAERNSQTALMMAETSGANEVKKLAYQLLALVYDDLDRPRDAYNVLWRHIEVKDSILNSENIQSINALREEFQAKEKEQQIALQELTLGQQEAELERNQILIIALILVAVLLVAVLLLVRVRSQKEKALIKREAELKLREAEINAVINSQEKERNRFARDLHDGFGQMISVLKLNLGQLKDLGSRDLEKRQAVFESGEKVISDMYEELRNICFDLMPQTLVKQGLNAALKEFGERINQNTRTSCEVMIFDEGARIPELVEVSLFRTVQEWVNNVLKYASANEIVIQVTREENELTLTIEDDGIGFDPQVFFEGSGHGWRNIQTRLNQASGQFELDSRPGVQGTMVTVNVMLEVSREIPTGTESEITA